MTVVTISGQAGSRAREIGRLAAERLHIDYVDQEILVQAASTLGVPVESVVSRDERAASRGERLANMMRRFLERSAAAGAGDPMLGTGGLDIVLGRTYGEAVDSEPQDVSDKSYVTTLTNVIREIATHGDVVIIGRGSQVILQDWPGATHVLLVAPLKLRVASIAERESISEEDASKRVHDGDKGRESFHQRFFKTHVNDPALYHVALNTSRYDDNAAADIIAQIAQRTSAAATT